MTASPKTENSPLSGTGATETSSPNDLVPLPKEPVSVASRILSCLLSCVTLPLAVVGGIVALIVFLLVTLTGIGPLLEFCQRRRDQVALDVDQLLKDHPEMMLLEIPADINHASLGQSYRVMVRITRPTTNDHNNLAPIIMPGGLASNILTMAKHQDELTQQHGFTVVQFDRLGVGWSDPYPKGASKAPSAADVACEMKYVMDHCGVSAPSGWISIGSSMGANVAAAFVALYPDDLAGFFNLDGLPHAFLQIQCKKFLVDGSKFMNILNQLQWTGLPRLIFSMSIKSILPAMGTSFTPRQIVGVMCREQFFVATGLEYTTLMSCCDLEVAAWGRQATTEYNLEMMRNMTRLRPHESVIVDEPNGVPRTVTQERSDCELGTDFVDPNDSTFLEFVKTQFRPLALTSPDQVDRTKTHCNWPSTPRHPVGDLVGGVDAETIIHPLAISFERMVVRVMCARCYKGLERDYTQNARNHAAARTSLHVLASANGKAYYYPRLTHMNLWQQCQEVVDIAHEMAQCIQDRKA